MARSTVPTLVVNPLFGPYWAMIFCVFAVGGCPLDSCDRIFDWMFGVPKAADVNQSRKNIYEYFSQEENFFSSFKFKNEKIPET